MLAVQHHPPAVADHLHHAVGDEGGRHRHEQRQPAHQQQTAGHAEHPRKGARQQDGHENEQDGERSHPPPTLARFPI